MARVFNPARSAQAIEIVELSAGHVVLSVPVLHLLVLGASLDEAVSRTKAAVAYRTREHAQPADIVVEEVGHRVQMA